MKHSINSLFLSLSLPLFLAALGFSLTSSLYAAELGPRQDMSALRKSVEQFLHVQSSGLPGEIEISVGSVDPHLYLASCPGVEIFLPPGNKAWGRTTVGARCSEPTHWAIYIPVTVHVIGDYVASVTQLVQGETISQQNVAIVHGDLTALPPGVITELTQAVGFTAARSLPPGMPLRQDSLRIQQAVQQGQTVRLVSAGDGFRITAEGHALSSGSEGQIVQAKTANGQTVSGTAKMGGVINVNF